MGSAQSRGWMVGEGVEERDREGLSSNETNIRNARKGPPLAQNTTTMSCMPITRNIPGRQKDQRGPFTGVGITG